MQWLVHELWTRKKYVYLEALWKWRVLELIYQVCVYTRMYVRHVY